MKAWFSRNSPRGQFHNETIAKPLGYIEEMKKTKYNDTNRMNELFDAVLERDFNGASIGEVKRAIENALGPLPFINWPMDNSWAVIRARQIDESREDITDPKTFGSPPSIETSLGRANLINHPVFYGTFDGRTAMQEINVPLQTECYVSTWEFITPPHVTTFLSNIDKNNDLFAFNSLVPEGLPTGLKGGYTEDSLARALYLRANAFTTKNYEFTSKIAHDIIYNKDAKSDGLIYPSVVDPYRCNIALHPEFVTSNMKCIRIYKMIWSGAFIFRTLSRGSLQGKKIIWEETGTYERDEIDFKYSGSIGPDRIHPSALEVLKQKPNQE